MVDAMDSASWIAIAAISVTIFIYVVTLSMGYGKLRARDSERADDINEIRQAQIDDMEKVRLDQQRLWDTRASRDDFEHLSKKLDNAIEVLGEIKVAVGSFQQAFADSNRRHDQTEEWRSSHDRLHQSRK